MFIKIEGSGKEPVLVNAETIRVIEEHRTPDRTFCRIEFGTDDTSLDVNCTLNHLEYLLDANSTEKQIALRKLENLRLRQQQDFDEVYETLMGGRK